MFLVNSNPWMNLPWCVLKMLWFMALFVRICGPMLGKDAIVHGIVCLNVWMSIVVYMFEMDLHVFDVFWITLV